MIRLFIGYREDTADIATCFSTILKALGIEVWKFEDNLQPGDEFLTEIEDMICNKADAAMFILNRNVLNSKIIMKMELNWAFKRFKNDSKFAFIPILCNEEFSFLKEHFLHYKLHDIHAIKLTSFEFDNILQESIEIFGKLLEMCIYEDTDPLTISVFDRGPEKPLESDYLHLDFTDLLGESEKASINSWGRLERILNTFSLQLKQRLEQKTIRLHGRMRYTTCFLLGYAFRETTGYKFKIDYNGVKIETPDNHAITTCHLKKKEIGEETSANLIVDISLSRANIDFIQKFIEDSKSTQLINTDPILSLTPMEGVGRNSIKNNIMTQQVALQLFKEIEISRNLCSSENIHLFINGPFPIALFLGWLWNAGGQVYIYEFNKANNTYFESPYRIAL